MATLTITVDSPSGSLSKSFNFPDTEVSGLIDFYKGLTEDPEATNQDAFNLMARRMADRTAADYLAWKEAQAASAIVPANFT